MDCLRNIETVYLAFGKLAQLKTLVHESELMETTRLPIDTVKAS